MKRVALFIFAAVIAAQGVVTVSTTGLWAGAAGIPYASNMPVATGGTPPYTWSVASGLPAWAAVSAATGVVSGNPPWEAIGVVKFSLQACDSESTPSCGSQQVALAITPQLDQYGGIAGVHPAWCPSHAWFQLGEDSNGRWEFCDPAGNAFLLTDIMLLGTSNFTSAAWSKYPSCSGNQGNCTPAILDLELWAQWSGFNTVGEYSTWHAYDGTQAQNVPFVAMATLGQHEVQGSAPKLKDVLDLDPSSIGDPSTGLIYRLGDEQTLFDVFDPAYGTYAQQAYVDMLQYIPGGTTLGNPWVVAASPGEVDEFPEWKAAGEACGSRPCSYGDPAYLVAIANFCGANGSTQSGIAGCSSNLPLFSKVAWINFLVTQYGNSIAALNSDWGTSYTSFWDNGGYGSGSGVIDENGSHIGGLTDPWRLSGVAAPIKAKLALFRQAMAKQVLYQWAYCIRNGCSGHAADPNVVIAGLNPLGGSSQTDGSSTGDCTAFVDHNDITGFLAAGVQLQVGCRAEMSSSVPKSAVAMDMYQASVTAGTPAPVYLWDRADSTCDSPPGCQSGMREDYATQSLRGAAVAAGLADMFGSHCSDGSLCIMGFAWWGMVDDSADNWGLASYNGNAYTGRDARMAAGITPWGITAGGEAANYGDFLDALSQALAGIQQSMVTSGSGQGKKHVYVHQISASGSGSVIPGITVTDLSGSGQSNRPVSLGRYFKKGDIPHYAQALVGGAAILTQCDVKNRWPDGSLKFAIVSFVMPTVSTGGTAVSFQDQSTGNNTGYLTQVGMLATGFDFEGQMNLTGTASPSISARAMLTAGKFSYWLQGPIVTAVIIEDRAGRSYDVNTDGGSGNPLHPIFEAWFYPSTNKVELGFTLENSWISHTAATSARNQTFALTLTTGNASPATQYTQASFTQIIFSRWRRAFWIDGAPGAIKIDYGWNYLRTTGAYPNFGPAFTPTETALENMLANYTSDTTGANAGRLTLPGIDSTTNGGIVQYDQAVGASGYGAWIGLYPQWDVMLLMTGDPRMRQLSTDNADLSGRFPIFFREADHNAGTGQYFDYPGTGSVDPYGHVVSINARQFATMNLANDWNIGCNSNAADFIDTDVPSDGSGWYTTPYDTSHLPDFAFVPYSLTGKEYYLEHELLEGGFAVGNGVGCYGATAVGWRQGHYGVSYTQTRGAAWSIRTAAYASFAAPDGWPEGPYYAAIVKNNIAMHEGASALTLDVAGTDPAWIYSWGANYFQFSQAANPSPLGFWRLGDCQSASSYYGGLAVDCFAQPANNIDNTVVQGGESAFMISFMDMTLGMIRQLGIVDTTALLTRDAHRAFNILLNPVVNHYLFEEPDMPTAWWKTPGPGGTQFICQNPVNVGCPWIANWSDYNTGYIAPLPTAWSTRGVDFGAEAMGALSFQTGISVDGYNGQTAYNFFTTDDAVQLGLVCANEPQWCILPIGQ